MSVTAYRSIWENSEATGTERLVLLALAEHVNENQLRAGGPPEAWPSIPTLAKMCRCHSVTVERALRALEARGEVADTGRRRRRRVRVWELPIAYPLQSTAYRDDPLQSAGDHQHPAGDHLQSAAPPPANDCVEPEVVTGKETEEETDSPLNPPRGKDDQKQKREEAALRQEAEHELERLEAQRDSTGFPEQTERMISALRAELGIVEEVAA